MSRIRIPGNRELANMGSFGLTETRMHPYSAHTETTIS